MTRENIREDINRRPLTDFIQMRRCKTAGPDMYYCPFCETNKGGNHTGALKMYPNHRVQCYSGNCFGDKGTDTLGALRILWNCNETEAMCRAGYTIDSDPGQVLAATRNLETAKPAAVDHTTYYQECHRALLNSAEGLKYLHDRGITDDSINRHNLGYDGAWRHPSSPNSVPTKRIIIPRSPESYVARLCVDPRNEYEAARKKQTTKQSVLFNSDAIKNADSVIVCEGELDAISLEQAGAEHVIGLGSIINTDRFLNLAITNPNACYLIALDNDADKEDGSNPGHTAQDDLIKKMKDAGLHVYGATERFYNGYKDANEAYLKSPQYLHDQIMVFTQKALEVSQAVQEARKEQESACTGAEMLADFYYRVTETCDYEEVPTGIKEVDEALEGGFTRKTLVMLGAAPAMGKTTLAQAILENMAMQGHDVLYINLEMERDHLLAKSISRLCWKTSSVDISSKRILQAYKMKNDPSLWNPFLCAINQYHDSIAPHFIYNPDSLMGTTGIKHDIDSILRSAREETVRLKALGRNAPIICIDYLQLIATTGDSIEGLKQAIDALKMFAIENNTIIIVITANNRASNNTGITTLESGRDTSAIEYSGDYVLGMSYAAVEDERTITYTFSNGKTITTGTQKEPLTLPLLRRIIQDAQDYGKPIPDYCKEISLRVLKTRFGQPQRSVRMRLDGRHSIFEILPNGFTTASNIPKAFTATDTTQSK